jgi:hypothetical protein
MLNCRGNVHRGSVHQGNIRQVLILTGNEKEGFIPDPHLPIHTFFQFCKAIRYMSSQSIYHKNFTQCLDTKINVKGQIK